MFDMIFLEIIWWAIQCFIGYNLIFPIALFLFWAIFKNRKASPESSKNYPADYGIIVTAYEQTDFLPAVVNSILRLNYDNYIIYIVADKCDISNLDIQDNPKVVVLRPLITLASNIKSHFYAIKNFQRPHDRLTIIDSDNLVHPEYLRELNIWFDKGYDAVQGVRVAKNLNTSLAALDAARDVYYHFYDGKLLFECGSSATLAGSGMAFTSDLYKDCLGQVSVQGAGFDKVLQYEILRRKKRIAYAEGALVYDEKTSESEQLVNQRARWIYTWFKYFKFGFHLIRNGIGSTNFNQFLFGLVLLRPPLFIFLGIGIIFLFINLFISIWTTFIWIFAYVLFILSFLISLKKSNVDAKIYKALTGIPDFIFHQIKALLISHKANQKSVATKHTEHTSIDDQNG